jgi:alkaline phosphatase isozyme conversion protein
MLKAFLKSLPAVLLLVTAIGPASAQTTGQVARAHVVALSEAIGSRLAGSPGEAQAADYIEGVFVALGYTSIRNGFAFAPESRQRGQSLISANVMAVKQGESDREIVVGAHYDSEVRGRGAGDNASGVGVLLEVAGAIRDVTTPYTIRFIAFGAEEQGLGGSHQHVSRLSQSEIDNTVAMINLDSLIAGEIAYVYGDFGEYGVIRDWVLALADAEGDTLRTQPGENPEYPAGTTCDCSDHAPFADAGIPYAYFESTNWSLGEKDGYVQVDPQYGEDGYIWHTRFDTLAYIDQTFPGRADQRLELFSRLLYRTLTEFTEP